MIELRLFGGVDITGLPLSQESRVRRRHPLALLALVVASPQPTSRDRIMGFLWPESDANRASNSLRQTLFLIRNELGEDIFAPERASGLEIDRTKLHADLWTFRDAMQRNAPNEAVDVYRGPFMDGFQIPSAHEFSHWMDAERRRLARRHVDALAALAEQADHEGRYNDAVSWRRRQAAVDPFSARAALALLRALVIADDRAGALEFAAIYTNLVRLHLEVEPDASVTEFVAALRSAPEKGLRGGREVRGAPAARVAEAAAAAAAPLTANGAVDGAGAADRAGAADHASAADHTSTTDHASAADRTRVGNSAAKPWRVLVPAAVALVALGVFAGHSLFAVRNAPLDATAIILASGIHTDAGRDTATQLVACEGPECPAGPLPQPAFLVARHPMYASPAPGTGYIGPVQNATTLASPGFPCCTRATFESAFTLPPNALSANISVSVLADNQASVAINGVRFGAQKDSAVAENYAGPALTFTTAFPPDPSGTNHLRIVLWAGGGADGLNYRAIVTYSVGNDPQSKEITAQ